MILLMSARSVDLNFLPSVDPETVLQTGKVKNKTSISDNNIDQVSKVLASLKAIFSACMWVERI